MTTTMLLALALASAQAQPQVPAPEPADLPETYTVQAGDTCAAIAKKLYGDEKLYSELHKYNSLGPLPHLLQVGLVLRLRAPAGAPSAEATLTFLKPSVLARQRVVQWSPAMLNMSLFRLDEVSTLKGAGAEVTFRDLSSLLMEENALIVIYGEPVVSRPRQPSGLSLVDGELRLSMAALRGSRSIRTPAAALAAEAPEGVVATDAARTTRLSLFEGRVKVSARGKEVAVERNHGTRVRDGNEPEAPRPLPEAPRLEGQAVMAIVWQEGGARVALQWGAVERAARYRVQLSTDEKFVARVSDTTTASTSAAVDGLGPGRYLARVIAFDDIDLQSRPSPPRSFDVVKLSGARDGEALVLARGAPLEAELMEGLDLHVDGVPATPPVKLAVGAHLLELKAPGGQVALAQVVLVPPSAPRAALGGPQRRTLRLTFADPLPEGQDPEVMLDGGTAVPVSRLDATTFEASLPSAGRYVVSWKRRELLGLESR